jgi:hypothetical protein
MDFQRLVRESRLLLASGEVNGIYQRLGLSVPPEIKQAYEKDPALVIEQLIAIATYGTSQEALHALAFGDALVYHPKAGAFLVYYGRHFNEFEGKRFDGRSRRALAFEGLTKCLNEDLRPRQK